MYHSSEWYRQKWIAAAKYDFRFERALTAQTVPSISFDIDCIYGIIQEPDGEPGGLLPREAFYMLQPTRSHLWTLKL